MTAGIAGEVREFLTWRTHGLMECQAVNAFENFPIEGGYLTTNGFDIGGRPKANLTFMGADEPFAQADGEFSI